MLTRGDLRALSWCTLLFTIGAGSSALAQAPAGERALLTGLVTTALAREPSLDVVTSEDVRKQVELEAARQVAGCTDATSTSCLAEIAGALGARLVVYGKLGQLGTTSLLTLNLYDSEANTAGGRAALQAPSLEALAAKVDGAVEELIRPWVAAHPAKPGTRTKVLVLDLEGADASASSSSSSSQASSPLPWALLGVGGGAALLGATALAVSGAAHVVATDPATLQKDVPGSYDVRDWSGWIGVVAAASGVVLLGAGGLLAVVGE